MKSIHETVGIWTFTIVLGICIGIIILLISQVDNIVIYVAKLSTTLDSAVTINIQQSERIFELEDTQDRLLKGLGWEK